MNPSLSETTPIYKLPPGRHKRLCRLLTIGGVWQDLAEVIPNIERTACRFTGEDIELLKYEKDPADKLLRAWKTDNATIGDLISCLKSAGLLRQAAYVCEIIHPSETKVIEIPVPETTKQMNNSGTDGTGECGLSLPTSSFDSIAAWTHGFDNRSISEGGCLLGKGGYADVFKGTDAAGRTVAVKKFKDNSASCKRQFENEISVQLKCRHENVICLIGYCSSPQGCLLVYEFMSNGSLEEFLECRDDRPVLSFEQRLSVAQDVACGIAYLNDNNLIHRDIKSANILLDEKLRAKLGDFGITRSGPSEPLSTSTETMVLIGTTPYMAPEYIISGRLSLRTDSFSFGVVLLEILTGLPAYDARREECTLLEHVRESFSEENYLQMADKRVDNWNQCIVKRIYDMAMSLCGKEKTRPLVSSVLEDINSWC